MTLSLHSWHSPRREPWKLQSPPLPQEEDKAAATLGRLVRKANRKVYPPAKLLKFFKVYFRTKCRDNAQRPQRSTSLTKRRTFFLMSQNLPFNLA